MLSENPKALGDVAAKVGTYNAKARSQKITGLAKYMAGVFDGARLPPPQTDSDGRRWQAVTRDANHSGEVKREGGYWWYSPGQ